MNPRLAWAFLGVALGVAALAWLTGTWFDRSLADAFNGMASR